MKKLLWIGLAVVLVGVILYGNLENTKEKSHSGKEIVKIGAILPLSGNNALIGEDYKNLYLWRLSEVPTDSKYEYQIVFADDQLKSMESATAAQKLLNLDNVDVLFASGSGGERSMVDLANQRKKVVISLLWDIETPKKSEYMFNALLFPDQYITLLLKRLQKLNLKNISMVIQNHQGDLLIANVIKELAPKYGITIIDEEYIPQGEKDFRIIVSKMENKNPDAYISILLTPSLEAWAKQIKEQKVLKPITSVNVFDFSVEKELLENAWYPSDNIISQEIADEYKKRYGKDLIIGQAIYGYVALDNIINAYESSDHKLSGKELSQKLKNMNRNNTLVGDIHYDTDGILHGSGVLKIIKNGKSVKLEE